MALSACGTTKWGFPYRPDVQQGNWITSEQVAQLQKGMTREQVRFILGTPTLQDVFRTNRWDYPYYNKPGYGKEQERKFTVWFEGDSLARWEGDEQPDRQPFQKADTGVGKEEALGKGTISSETDSNGAAAAGASGGAQAAPVDTVAPRADTAPAAPQAPAEPATESAAPQHRQPILNTNESRPSAPGVPTPGRSSGEPLR
nr:outer membrane protein assembly factor BamE [Pollutimonas bauzanensis]